MPSRARTRRRRRGQRPRPPRGLVRPGRGSAFRVWSRTCGARALARVSSVCVCVLFSVNPKSVPRVAIVSGVYPLQTVPVRRERETG